MPSFKTSSNDPASNSFIISQKPGSAAITDITWGFSFAKRKRDLGVCRLRLSLLPKFPLEITRFLKQSDFIHKNAEIGKTFERLLSPMLCLIQTASELDNEPQIHYDQVIQLVIGQRKPIEAACVL